MLVDRLAVGGMAEVFRALEPRSAGEPRSVVIKRMLPALSTEPGSRAMFQEEARLGRLVRHPQVVSCLGYAEEAGQPFLVLEYVRGVDLWKLTRWLTRSGQVLTVPIAMLIVRDLLSGLHALHEATDDRGESLQIVHRDVSPSNVLLSVHGDIKLADLGIAQARMREQYPQAPLGTRAKGKLGYLAPEQVHGESPDRRCDVFSAAVIAAELLMGRPLFAGGSELAVLLAIRDAKVHPFLEIAPRLPSGLGEAILRGLARNPDERIATADELRERLEPFVFGEGDAEDELRSVLGEMVGKAMGMRDSASNDELTPPRPSGRPTLDTVDQQTPQALVDLDMRTPAALISDRPPTAELPLLEYQVRTQSGQVLGQWPYARVVEAVSTGKLGRADRVSVSGQAYKAIEEITDLARHLPPSSLTPVTRERQAPPAPHETTRLDDGGIITALAGAVVRRETGLWLCELGGVRKEIYVKDGVPEFVTSNLAGELLGEYLVARGVISRGELDMALAVMPRFEGRLGDTLAALGLVEPVHLFQHIAGQVREKLLDLFTWTAGSASFYRGVAPPSSAFPLGLDPWAILNEGIRRRFAQGLEDHRFEGRQRARLARATPFPREIARAQLPPDLKQLLDALQTPRTLAEIGELIADPRGRDKEKPFRVVILLLHLNAVRWI